MAQKRKSSVEKKIKRNAKKFVKKNSHKPAFIILAIIIITLVLAGCYCIKSNPELISNLISNSTSSVSDETTTVLNSDSVEGVVYDEFQIHFLELGNAYAGDSIYIKAGDKDILIDAGSRQSSATVLETKIDEYVTDNKLEYVIATHGDQDHISGMIGTSSKGSYNGILYHYDVDNIIYNERTSKTTNTYKNFITAADYVVANGAIRTYAHEFFESDGLTASNNVIQLSDNVTMTILWNYYYFNDTSDENDYSVCTLFTYTSGSDVHNFLLTGDLEGTGEEYLAVHYNGGEYGSLPHCDLFKAGHHGSKTSSTMTLLNAITPDICCVCTCAGTNEYTTDYNNQFPTQQFINRIAQFTDKVYITSMWSDSLNSFTSMNGEITISCGLNENNEVVVGIAASNNLTKLKDTEWFNETIYVTNYKEASSTDLDNVNCCSHGQNSDKTGSNTFYTADTSGVTAVPRRVWPE